MNLQELDTLKQSVQKPLVYCLCGSTGRAQQAFQDEMLRLTLEGHIVLSVGANSKDADLQITPVQKVQLDILHLFKIDIADVVRILNVNGYIGESTQREEEYAYERLAQGKLLRIEYLEQQTQVSYKDTSMSYRDFLEATADNEEYSAWIEHIHTPSSDNY